jgi:hypothetical protein
MVMTAAERARNYRKRKADERAKAGKGRGGVKASRGVTRQAKRDEARADRVQRAVALLDAPIPPRGELLDEALRILRSVGLDPGAAESSRVAAGRALMVWAGGRSPTDRRGEPGSQETTPAQPSSPQDVPAPGPEKEPTLDDLLQ